MKLICKKNSLKGKKADRPYNSDLTLFTLNLKTRENQKDFAARSDITMSSWLWCLNTRQYQRRYNKDPTTNPGTLTTYYVCSVPGLDAASSCTLLEQYIKCSCYYFGVTLDSPLALLGILTDLKIKRIVQIIVRKSEMKRDFLVLVLSGTHIFSDNLKLSAARPGVWFRERFFRHYKYVSGFSVDRLVSEKFGLS